MDKILRYLSENLSLIFGIFMGACAVKAFFALLTYFSMYNVIWLIICCL